MSRDTSPVRDPASWHGCYTPPVRPPRPCLHMATHEHMCPDGTVVTCTSQLLLSLGRVMDRYSVAGWRIATSARVAHDQDAHRIPPDFGWVDARMQPPVAA